MRLWESSKGLVIGTVVAVVVWLIVRSWVIGPVVAEAEGLRSDAESNLDELATMAPSGGTPIADAMKGLDSEKKALDRVREELKEIEFELDAPYQDVERAQPRLYFEQELARVRQKLGDGTVAYGSANQPLGFKGDVLKEKVPDLLRRLALADHASWCAEMAGVQKVISVGHGEARAYGEGLPVYLSEYPLTITIEAHERALISMLHRLQRRGKCAPVQALSIKVTDAESGSFQATLQLGSVFVVKKPRPKAAGGGDDDDPYKLPKGHRPGGY